MTWENELISRTKPSSTREMEQLVWSCRADGSQDIICCDVHARHLTWKSTNTKERGEYLLQFIVPNNLDVLNLFNKPTSGKTRCREVIDEKLSTTYISNYVRKWNVSDEEVVRIATHCLWNRRFLYLHQNLRKTNWENYKKDIKISLEWIDFEKGI